MPHLEPHRRAALLHRLHCILNLEDAPLWAPGRHVLVILQERKVVRSKVGKVRRRRREAAEGRGSRRQQRLGPSATQFWIVSDAKKGFCDAEKLGHRRSAAQSTSCLVAKHGACPVIAASCSRPPASRSVALGPEARDHSESCAVLLRWVAEIMYPAATQHRVVAGNSSRLCLLRHAAIACLEKY